MSELRRNLQINGEVFQLAVSQYGDGAPQATTPGKPGVLYLNTFNGNLYKCTAADPDNDVYTWVPMVGAGSLFATSVKGAGAEEISVQTLKIHKPNVGYVLSIGDKLITPDNYLYEITALPADLTSGYTAKLVQQLGGSLSPNAELFDKADLVDPAGRNSFITQDGVEYYRYNATAQSFEWVNPSPAVGAVTITARGVSQYGGTGGTRLLTVYDDGTYGPELYIVVGGESQTVTVTTDENKTLSKITGNYDMENWVLLDMSVMSVKAEYLVQEEYVLPVATADNLGGIKADPATDADTIPARIKNGRLFVAGATDAQIADAVNTYIEDNPISGGSKDLGNFRLIAQISTEEDISDYEITTDESGMAFALDEVIILIDDVTESNSPGFGYQSYFVNDMQLAGYVHNFVNKTKMFYMVKKGNRIYYEEMSATESVTADYSFAGINNRDYGAHGISRIIDAKICKINIKRMTCTTGNFTITMLGR